MPDTRNLCVAKAPFPAFPALGGDRATAWASLATRNVHCHERIPPSTSFRLAQSIMVCLG